MLYFVFILSAVHNKERNFRESGRNISLCRCNNSMNMEHNKEQNQCSYEFTESHKQRNVGINRNINKN